MWLDVVVLRAKAIPAIEALDPVEAGRLSEL
jgi:hypothetical protein